MNIVKTWRSSTLKIKNGFLLTDGDCINSFSALLTPLIKEIHGFAPDNSENLENKQNVNEFNLENPQANTTNFPWQDKIKDQIHQIRFSYSRNLHDTPYSIIISNEKRQAVEALINKAITSLESEKIIIKKAGKYLTMKDNQSEITNILKDIEFSTQFHENFSANSEFKNSWPENRGIFHTEDNEIIILINFVDHVQLIVTQNNKNGIDLVKSL